MTSNLSSWMKLQCYIHNETSSIVFYRKLVTHYYEYCIFLGLEFLRFTLHLIWQSVWILNREKRLINVPDKWRLEKRIEEKKANFQQTIYDQINTKLTLTIVYNKRVTFKCLVRFFESRGRLFLESKRVVCTTWTFLLKL